MPFRPVLRAALLTGSTPRYLRTEIGARDDASAGSAAPLWWPPAKVAGRLLAPYLRGMGDADQARPLEDLEPLEGEDRAESEADHRDVVELALTMAEADAGGQDLRGALRWLDIAEGLDLALPREWAERRERWEGQLRGGGDLAA